MQHPPTLIGDLIAELMGAGMSRSEIAEALGVKGPLVSQYKAGDAYPRDETLPVIADMAQRRLGKHITKEELLANKWLWWCVREKGLTTDVIRRYVGMFDQAAA